MFDVLPLGTNTSLSCMYKPGCKNIGTPCETQIKTECSDYQSEYLTYVQSTATKTRWLMFKLKLYFIFCFVFVYTHSEFDACNMLKKKLEQGQQKTGKAVECSKTPTLNVPQVNRSVGSR